MSTNDDADEAQPFYSITTTEITADGPDQTKAKFRWITVEPVVFLAFVGNGTFSTIRSEYLQKRIGEDVYNYTFIDDSNMSCVTNASDPDFITQQHIQEDASNWTLYLSICSFLPLIFTAIIIGSWSDTAGRKKAMVIPLLGMIARSVVYLIVLSRHLPLIFLIIGELAYGIFGGGSLLVSISLAYIADVTTLEQRTFRVVVVETILLFAIGSAQLAMGYVIAGKGFVLPFYLLLACQVTGIAYILIPAILYESTEPKEGGSLSTLIMSLFRGVVELFSYNVDNRRWRLLLMTAIFMLIMMTIQGYASVIILYGIGQPFCWSSILVGIYMATSLLLFSVSNIAGQRFFQLCLSDIWTLHITLFSSITSRTMLGLAETTFVVFLSVVFGCVRALSVGVIRSMASKCVSPSEQGVVFAFLASVDSIAAFLAPILFQLLYAATAVNGDHGSPFYLAAGLGVLAEICALILHGGFLTCKSGENKMN